VPVDRFGFPLNPKFKPMLFDYQTSLMLVNEYGTRRIVKELNKLQGEILSMIFKNRNKRGAPKKLKTN